MKERWRIHFLSVRIPSFLVPAASEKTPWAYLVLDVGGKSVLSSSTSPVGQTECSAEYVWTDKGQFQLGLAHDRMKFGIVSVSIAFRFYIGNKKIRRNAR